MLELDILLLALSVQLTLRSKKFRRRGMQDSMKRTCGSEPANKQAGTVAKLCAWRLQQQVEMATPLRNVRVKDSPCVSRFQLYAGSR